MRPERKIETKITTRKPVSRPMLVCYEHEWQVCYQARGKLYGRRITAWVYGKESIFFCEVGEESLQVQLPQPNQRPFFDDQFVHMIESVDKNGIRHERLGGANDIFAANAAYQVIKQNCSWPVALRDGSRVIRKSDEEGK